MKGYFGSKFSIFQLCCFSDHTFSSAELNKLHCGSYFWSHIAFAEHSVVQMLPGIMHIQKFSNFLLWCVKIQINVRYIGKNVKFIGMNMVCQQG